MEGARWTTAARAARVATATLAALCALPGASAGQELGGRVVEAGTDTRVAGALVRLIDDDGGAAALSVSDSTGAYRLATPGPGNYRVTVEALGYAPFESHLLAVGQQSTYVVDLELWPAPLPISGIEISADRFADLERGLRLVIGVHPRSLRHEPILRPEIEDHLARAHGLTEVVRWSNLPSVVTRETPDGPCFQWRNRHCMPVYLNGAELTSGTVPVLPLDMLEMIVIMTPGESIAYPGGAVLLYTPGWIG